jgi:hypothetical protein
MTREERRIDNITKKIDADPFSTMYLRREYAIELEKLISRPVKHVSDKSYIEVHGMRYGSKDAERVKAIAKAHGFLLCGQVPVGRQAGVPDQNEPIIIMFHLASWRIKRELNKRSSNPSILIPA